MKFFNNLGIIGVLYGAIMNPTCPTIAAGSCNRPEVANGMLYPLEKEQHDIRVISYNIRGENKTDRAMGNGWPIRKHKIKKLCDYYKPDIVGFQEVSSSYMVDLKNMFPDYTVIAFDLNEIDKDAALLLRSDRFKCLDIDYFWLAEDPIKKHSPSWDSRATRIVVYAKVQDVCTHKEFYVFCTHFDSSGVQARFESARLLRKQQKIIAKDSPVIILGDFNLHPDKNAEEIYREFIWNNELHDVRDLGRGHHYGPDGSWIGWAYDSAAVAPGKVGARIDHIFVRNFAVLKEGVLNIKIDEDQNIIDQFNKKYSMIGYPSDHLPVIADIAA